MSQTILQYEDGVAVLDAGYLRPGLAAIHLIVDAGRVAVIDSGNNEALPHVLAALAELGLDAASVDYLILSHIHLDHAGGAGTLMRAMPNARLLVHPRGARHMADPSKLLAGAAVVYGATEVRRMYGEVVPVPAERIVAVEDGQFFPLGGRQLQCIEAPGHAKHHIAVIDASAGAIFTGDAFGISYRELDTDGRQFIFPTTTPVQFDPEATRATIARFMSYAPRRMYLTHFGALDDPARHAAELLYRLDAILEIAHREAQPVTDRCARIRANLAHLLLDEAEAFGCRLDPAEILRIWETDIELNAQGIDVWLAQQQATGKLA